MSGHGEWTERTEVAAVFEGEKAKRDYNEQDGLFMDMPTK